MWDAGQGTHSTMCGIQDRETQHNMWDAGREHNVWDVGWEVHSRMCVVHAGDMQQCVGRGAGTHSTCRMWSGGHTVHVGLGWSLQHDFWDAGREHAAKCVGHKQGTRSKMWNARRGDATRVGCRQGTHSTMWDVGPTRSKMCGTWVRDVGWGHTAQCVGLRAGETACVGCRQETA